MTIDEIAERLEELRALDDPRTNPKRPYTPEYSHLEERWTELAPDGADGHSVKAGTAKGAAFLTEQMDLSHPLNLRGDHRAVRWVFPI